MKRSWLVVALLIVSGCSTAPVCDFLDCVAPTKMPKNQVTPYGGVCAPGQGTHTIGQGLITPSMPTTPPVNVPVIPGPAPLPPPTSPFIGPSIIPPPPPPPVQK